MNGSGMSYEGVIKLCSALDEKKQRISEIMQTIENERTSEVSKVYGGQAADNFKSNAISIATTVNDAIEQMITDLRTVAETQQQEYKEREVALQQNVNVQ